jgi:CrcB protein
MVKILLIAAGGGAGALLRYLVSGLVYKVADSPFPFGTLVVNVFGCLVAGSLFAYFSSPHLVREEYRVALLIGVLGAFTTFSTFSWETLSLARDGELRLALVNVVLTNVLALTALWFGYRITEKWFGA